MANRDFKKIERTIKDFTLNVEAKGSGGGGTTVIANPEGEATEDLTKLQVGDTIYGIPEGSGEASSDIGYYKNLKVSDLSQSKLALTQNNDLLIKTFIDNNIDYIYAYLDDISLLPEVQEHSETAHLNIVNMNILNSNSSKVNGCKFDLVLHITYPEGGEGSGSGSGSGSIGPAIDSMELVLFDFEGSQIAQLELANIEDIVNDLTVGNMKSYIQNNIINVYSSDTSMEVSFDSEAPDLTIKEFLIADVYVQYFNINFSISANGKISPSAEPLESLTIGEKEYKIEKPIIDFYYAPNVFNGYEYFCLDSQKQYNIKFNCANLAKNIRKIGFDTSDLNINHFSIYIGATPQTSFGIHSLVDCNYKICLLCDPDYNGTKIYYSTYGGDSQLILETFDTWETFDEFLNIIESKGIITPINQIYLLGAWNPYDRDCTSTLNDFKLSLISNLAYIDDDQGRFKKIKSFNMNEMFSNILVFEPLD